MGRKLLFTVLWAGIVCTASGTVDAVPPTGYWPFDGNLSDIAGTAGGTFAGGQPSYQRGQIGQAISFDGVDDYVDIPSPANPAFYTISAWVKPARTSDVGIVTRTDVSGPTTSWSHQLRIQSGVFHHYLWVGAERNVPGKTVIVPNTWYHVVIVAQNNGAMRLYVNGKEDGASVDTAGTLWATGTRIFVGSNSGHAMGWFQGLVDDLRIYDQILTAEEIQKSMKSLSAAVNVSPEDGATDVPRDATLNWVGGQYPATHDVYLGTVAADVNNASRTNPNGLLAGQGQAETSFDPAGSLAYGQTYYWRIDEVNTSADGTIHKGAIWSFTAEPYGYPITSVTATASSAAPNMGPEKTIDGSGLDRSDLHGIDGTTMWLTAGVAPNWIQYQFDKVYKLYDLKVWNSNQMIEGFLGFGAKKVTIEYSADGVTWTALANVPEFARATGMPGYAVNTTVNMGGVMARFVKLTINANWGGMAPQTGLSEVRFSYVPVQARVAQPTTAATGITVDPSLNWRPGREAGSHQVFFGADPNAVANGTVAAKTVADHAFAPGSLNFGTAYYWKVDEVNTVTYPGEVWSFTTQEYAAIDNFETYNDDDNRIYDAWIDGYTDGKSGSIVGNMQAPFAEQTIIHGGKQSMPFEYNNVKAPYYSEASRTFDVTQNWATNGADTLSLWFRGSAAVAFVDNGNSAYTVGASGTDIWNDGDQFRFIYRSLSGNGSIAMRVDSLVNTNAWAKAGPMIRETLDPGSKHAMMAVTPGNSCAAQYRNAAAGASASTNWTGTAVTPPYWARVTRTGNVFRLESSPDGKTWTALGADVTITMATNVYIGIAVTSHDATLTTTAEISNVSTTGTITGSWQALAIGATMVTNGPTSLYLTVEDKAGKTKTVVNPNPSASVTGVWTQWKIPLSDLTGVNAAAVKKITLGVGDKASPKAGATGMLYFDDIGYGHPAQ